MSFDKAKKYLAEMSEILVGCADKREKLETLIEIGKELNEIEHDSRVDSAKVPGCVSNVYILVSLGPGGTLQFRGSSDALIVKGYVQILTTVATGLNFEEITTGLEPLIQEFISETEISESLVATRANAFGSIFRFMIEKSKQL